MSESLQTSNVSGAQSPPPANLTQPSKRKLRVRRHRLVWGFRLLTYSLLGVFALAIVGYFTARLVITPKRIRSLIKETVEAQTGGRLEIAGVDFDLLHGLTLNQVQFYAPNLGDQRGHLYGGGVAQDPIADFEALKIGYSIPKIFAGKVYITALQLVGPQVHLRQTDGVFNFQSILDYRAKAFPLEPDTPQPIEPTTRKATPEAMTPPEFLLSPTLAYMPIEILTRNIGIANLSFELLKEEMGRTTQIITSRGLSLDIGVHWFGNKSSFWLSILSPVEHPLEISIQEAKRDAEGKLSSELAETLALRTALSMRAELNDLQRVRYDLDLRIASLNTPHAGYDDVGMHARARIEADDAYKTIKIHQISADLANVLTYGLSGRLTLSNYAAESIYTKLTQNFEVDLDQAERLAKPFLPELKMGGVINSDAFGIEGNIEPQKLAKAAENPQQGLPIPNIWGAVWIEELWASYPETGIDMEPVSGDIQLMVGPAMNSDGTQLDLDIDMLIPAIQAQQSIPKVGKVTAGVSDMQVKLTTRALYPAMIAPIFKLNIEASHVRARGDHVAAFDVPLTVDVDADGRADLQRMGLTAHVELADLVDFSASAECQARCERFRSAIQARLDSLAKIHAIALPLGASLGLAEFMPTKLAGSADLQFQARGQLPDPMATPPLELISAADMRWSFSTSVDKLHAKVPFFETDLRGFGTRIIAGGTTKDQRIEVSSKFDKVNLLLPMLQKTEGGPQSLEVQRFTFDHTIQNDIYGVLDLNKIPELLQKMATSSRAKLSVGRIAGLEGILPKPISDLQFNVEVEQQKLADVQIRSVSARIPDFGVNIHLQADARITPEFVPQRLKLDFKTDVAMSGAEPVPMGLKTSGGMSIRLGIESDDVQLALAPGAKPVDIVKKLVIRLDGGTSFDQFNVRVPDFKDPSKPPLLIVEDIRGEIPFKQTVDVRAILVMLDEFKRKTKNSESENSKKTIHASNRASEVFSSPGSSTEKVQTDQALSGAIQKYFDKRQDKLLKNANAAAMVDYGAVRPFYPERHPLSIKRIEAANLELSSLEFDLELRQNWFAINQYVMNFLGGKIHGDLQFAFDPIPKFFRTSVHMTKLDTRKLLDRFPNLKGKTKSSLNLMGSDPEIDGTVRFAYDVAASDMNGGIEITKIGKEQVEMMLYFIDPYEQNPSIADLRKALLLGEPSHVSIPIKSSRVGFEIEITSPITLGQPIPGLPKFRDIPINQIVDGFIEKVLADAQKAESDIKPPGDDETLAPTDASKSDASSNGASESIQKG